VQSVVHHLARHVRLSQWLSSDDPIFVQETEADAAEREAETAAGRRGRLGAREHTLLLVGIAAIYFLPSIIAARRDCRWTVRSSSSTSRSAGQCSAG
jgi:hypothetical protein